jgi:uncharacterized protein YndB with AHSA1/START domain
MLEYLEVCPTDVLNASAERVWLLLTDPRALAQWTGTTLVERPPGPLQAGDRFVLRAGVFRMTFDVLDIRPPRQLTLDVGLPFGVTNHEQIQVASIDAQSCRVAFN